jgi:hypothetical protein
MNANFQRKESAVAKMDNPGRCLPIVIDFRRPLGSGWRQGERPLANRPPHNDLNDPNDDNDPAL